MKGNHADNAKLFKAFCDETRLMVLSLLQNGERCVCVLTAKLKLAQPKLSYHMKVLVESGIVKARREGKWIYYSISEEGSNHAIRLMRELTEVISITDETDQINKEYCR